MQNNLIDTLEQIIQLSSSALVQAKHELEERRKNFKILKLPIFSKLEDNNMPKILPLPKGFRKFRNSYQGRKTVRGHQLIVYSTNLKDCIAKLALAEADFNDFKPDDYTFGSWLDEWLLVYKIPKLKPSSISAIESCIRLHISSAIKLKPLSALTAIDVQKSLNSIPYSRMRRYTYNVYNGALSRAFRLNLIPHNLMDNVENSHHDYKLGVPLTPLELKTFLAKVEDVQLKAYFLFCLYSGCRRSEVLSVAWSDIDFQNSTIAIHVTKPTVHIHVIPLFPQLRALVDTIPQTGRLLFTFLPGYVTHKFHVLCPEHKLHDLRHTFATRCLECGISMKVVQSWLGHTNINTTSDIYSHVQTDFEKKEIIKLNFEM